jgi:hypothetical protein
MRRSVASAGAISGAALVLALGVAACMPPAPDVVFIGPGAPDSFHDDPHDAMAALDLATGLEIPPEAMLPLAGYLAAAHRRIHASFAEGSLLEFERGRPPLERDLDATLDLSLSEAEGRVVDLRLSQTSGVDSYDAATIAGALHASPFGAPPPDIVAGDARAHLAWRFHRRAADPCALANALVIRAVP